MDDHSGIRIGRSERSMSNAPTLVRHPLLSSSSTIQRSERIIRSTTRSIMITILISMRTSMTKRTTTMAILRSNPKIHRPVRRCQSVCLLPMPMTSIRALTKMSMRTTMSMPIRCPSIDFNRKDQSSMRPKGHPPIQRHQPSSVQHSCRRICGHPIFPNQRLLSVSDHVNHPCSYLLMISIGIVGSAVVGLLAGIVLIMFFIYRVRKKDEGSYVLDEGPIKSPSHAYTRVSSREFFA